MAWIKKTAHSPVSRLARPANFVADMLKIEACFGAGTPLLTPEGHKNVEDFNVGDLILSRDENNPESPLEAKPVEEVFVRAGHIVHLHVAGQVIRTTAEHPFYVQDKGWKAAGGLAIGDLLASHDGQWVPVEDLLETGELKTVYNLRVAEYHTYFVGGAEWGFSVWAHNTYQADQAIVRKIQDFMDEVATTHKVPREMLVVRSLNRSGTDRASIDTLQGIVRGSGKTTATQHVLGTGRIHPNDPWVSASRTAEGAHYFGTHGFKMPQTSVIAIDLRRLNYSMLDVSTPELAAQSLKHARAVNFAATHAEVLVRGGVNPEAILGRLDF